VARALLIFGGLRVVQEFEKLVAILTEKSHSTELRGGVCHSSSKAARREDLQIEQPILCWDFSSFYFYPTLTRMLGATLIRDQVVSVRLKVFWYNTYL